MVESDSAATAERRVLDVGCGQNKLPGAIGLILILAATLTSFTTSVFFLIRSRTISLKRYFVVT